MNKEEEWRDIIWFEWYQISNIGRVKSLPKFHKTRISWYWTKEKILKWAILSWYCSYSLWRWVWKLAHRLVAITFIPNPENKKEVNHIDSNPLNNAVENLEWVTSSENSIHSYRFWHKVWIWKGKKWTDNPRSKSISQFDLQWNLIKIWESNVIAASVLWFSPGNISSCANWRLSKAYNYIWKFSKS